MKQWLVLSTLLMLAFSVYAQQSSKAQKRERIWVYDVNIIKDDAGRIVRVEKVVFGKGSPGAASQIRYFETKEKRDAAGNVIYSTRERVGENNVAPEIVKQYGNDNGTQAQPEHQ